MSAERLSGADREFLRAVAKGDVYQSASGRVLRTLRGKHLPERVERKVRDLVARGLVDDSNRHPYTLAAAGRAALDAPQQPRGLVDLDEVTS